MRTKYPDTKMKTEMKINDTVIFKCDETKAKYIVKKINRFYCDLESVETKELGYCIDVYKIRLDIPEIDYILLQSQENERLKDTIMENGVTIQELKNTIDELTDDVDNAKYDTYVLQNELIDNCTTQLDKINKQYELMK